MTAENWAKMNSNKNEQNSGEIWGGCAKYEMGGLKLGVCTVNAIEGLIYPPAFRVLDESRKLEVEKSEK